MDAHSGKHCVATRDVLPVIVTRHYISPPPPPYRPPRRPSIRAMDGLQDRIDSFYKAKRVKTTKKFMKWPHPLHDRTFKATPEALAEAGFYYNPSAAHKDNVTCFMCSKSLSEWEEDDDPFEIHYEKCGQDCHWAYLRCGLRTDTDHDGHFVFPDKSRFPKSKAIERARLATFKEWGLENPSAEKALQTLLIAMAQAGFVYTPMKSGDDLATCLYCNVALSGWDPGDNPLEEHRKREVKNGPCPFFYHSSGNSQPKADESTRPPSRAASNKPPSRSSAKPASRKQTRSASVLSTHQDTVQATKTRDGRNDDESDYQSTQNTDVNLNKSTGKARSASGSSKRVVSRSRSKGTQLEHVEEEHDSEEQEEVKPKRKTKANAKSKTREVVEEPVEDPEGNDEEVEVDKVEEEVKSKPKRGRGRPPKIRQEDVQGEDVEEALPKAKTKKKGRQTRMKAIEPEEEEQELEVGEEEPRTMVKSRAKGKGRAKTHESEDDDVEVEADRLGKEKATSKPKPQEEREVDLMEVDDKPKHKTTSKPRSSIEVEPDEVDRRPNEEPKVKSKTKPGSKPRSKVLREEEEESIERVKVTKSTAHKGSNKVVEPDDIPQPELSEISDAGRRKPPVKENPLAKIYETPPEVPSVPDADMSPPTARLSARSAKEEATRQLPRKGSTKETDSISTGPSLAASRSASASTGSSRTRISSSSIVNGKVVHRIEVSSDEEEVRQSLMPGPDDFTVQLPVQGAKQLSARLQAKPRGPPAARPASSGDRMIVEDTQPPPVKSKEPDAVFVPPQPVSRPRDPTPPIEDVSMLDGTQDSVAQEPAQPERFVTPPRQLSSVPPPRVVTPPPPQSNPPAPQQATIEAEPIYPTPPLSLLPFTPLTSLSSAELDMTVEEWIRYQIGVEYDKFKRDGMRELEKFKRKTEEVRTHPTLEVSNANLACGQTCRSFATLSASATVWMHVLHREVLRRGLPIPKLEGRHWSSLVSGDVERSIINALRLWRNWSSSDPRPLRRLSFMAPPASKILALHFLAKGRGRWLLCLSMDMTTPPGQEQRTIHLKCWDLEESPTCCVASRDLRQFPSLVVNSDPNSPAMLAIRTALGIEVLTLIPSAEDPESGFAVLRTIAETSHALGVLSGSRMLSTSSTQHLHLYNIESDDPPIEIGSQMISQPDQVLEALILEDLVISIRSTSIEICSLSDSAHSSQGQRLIRFPIASYMWPWRIDTVAMTPSVILPPSKADSQQRYPPIQILIRFGSFFPWPINILHHYTLDPNEAFDPNLPASKLNSPYQPIPTLRQMIGAPVRLFAVSHMIVGKYGTAVWLDSHSEDHFGSADYGQRIAGRILTKPSHYNENIKCNPPAGGIANSKDMASESKAIMEFDFSEDDRWTKVAMVEEEGRLAVASTHGEVLVYDYV
ncbi:hypothetical protein AX16_001476 [Volvariella volvacea WC 439]|nr:hypothetical protein AX16_001476 [Volvariella volvacea WC 439]